MLENKIINLAKSKSSQIKLPNVYFMIINILKFFIEIYSILDNFYKVFIN